MGIRVACTLFLLIQIVFGYPHGYDYNQGRSVPGTEHSGLNGFGQGNPWPNGYGGNQGLGYGNRGHGYNNQEFPQGFNQGRSVTGTVNSGFNGFQGGSGYQGQPGHGGNQAFGQDLGYGSRNHGFGTDPGFGYGNQGIKSTNPAGNQQYKHRGGYQEYGY